MSEPQSPASVVGDAPSYAALFGAAPYVADLADPSLIDLAARLATLYPNLGGSGRFASHANGGALVEADVRALQRFLLETGEKQVQSDGQYGPVTHLALMSYLVDVEESDSP